MKTKNKIQKTVLKSLAVIAGFIMISLTVSAQDLWKSLIESETAKEIALAIIEKDNESHPTPTSTKERTDLNSSETLFKTESENTMELEEWMTSEYLFTVEENPTKKKNFRTSTFVFEESEESKIEFETWMYNPKYWRVRK